MFKGIIPYLILFLSLTTQAQNLVYNGQFEIYSQCPPGNSLYPSNMYMAYANGWNVSALTPDYHHACSSSSNNVPYSYTGYQNDCCGGVGYAGMYMFAYDTIESGREYIYTQLLDTLIAGSKYLAGMYVNRANFNYSVSSIGMLFTPNKIILPWPQGYISASPQVKGAIVFSDTANWVRIQDTITATGGELFLTIGNFNTNVTSDTIKSVGTWDYYGAAYYYVDSISVTEINSMSIHSVEKEEVVIIHPNPASDYFQMTYSLKQNAVMTIYDVSGKLVGKHSLNASQTMAEIKNEKLQNGIYLYRIITNTGNQLKTGKIVVMK
jgi:hypothetical protein